MTTEAHSLILVAGEDEYLRSETTRRMVAAQRAARSDDELTIERVDSQSSDAIAAFSDAISPALFGGDRLVIVSAAEQATKDLVSAIEAYVRAPDPGICMIIEHTGGGRAKALAVTVQKAGAFVERVPVVKSLDDRIKYVRAEAAAAGGRMDPPTASALVDAVGEDLRALSSAARQLVSDSDGVVDSQVVARYHRGRADVKIYAIADEIAMGNSSSALAQLRWALHEGTPEVVIADAIAETIRSVARVAAAGRGDPNTLARDLGMPAWKIRRTRASAAGWSANGLTEAMQIVATLNADVKGGATNVRYALERAVLDLTRARDLR